MLMLQTGQTLEFVAGFHYLSCVSYVLNIQTNNGHVMFADCTGDKDETGCPSSSFNGAFKNEEGHHIFVICK